MIEVRNVSKSFDNVNALSNVSLRIAKGEVTALLGPNGAGKSTLFKVVAGLLNPDSGKIKPEGEVWPTMAYKPDRLLFPNRLSVRSYLKTISKLSKRPNTAQIDDVLRRVNLIHAGDKKIATLSKGMRQRLGLAQAMMGNPSLLLLDEPSNGLDPDGQLEMQRIINELRSEGRTILVSSHQLQEIQNVGTQIVILNDGRVRYANSMAAALALRPHVNIQVDRDLNEIAPLIRQLHEEIVVEETRIELSESAVPQRRRVLTMLLGAGYDIMNVEYSRKTLAEIYAEALR